jgi:alpha-amylase
MTPKIYLSLALHNHQPVGNFGWVFREAFEKSYLPLVECLERHPAIRLALHYTGPLRDWLLENQPDFFPRLRKLVERGQIEIMGGAYYEPVLASLRDMDKLGQIRKQSEAVYEDFGVHPTGLWLAERVWEPHLPSTLAEAGIQYTIVDDTHFKAIGYRDEDLLGYYVTEERGRTLKVFGTSMPLRYSIPWRSVEEVIDWLRQQSEAEDAEGRYAGRVKVAVMGDDGEKFGLWPTTYEHVWEKGWMDRFFTALEENSDWVETIPPGDFAQNFLSLGRIYLPTSSYDEMGEWAMPPDAAWELPHLKHQLQAEGRADVVKYMRGGLWRQFMVKYAEVNQLHKKALWVSHKVHAMREDERKARALDHLWAGQCNCAYWHGVFGGIYLFHIREADYRHLILAENIADGLDEDQEKGFVHSRVFDFDCDAGEDVILTSDRQSLVFDLDQGGSLVEWDYRPAAYNLLNVLTRRREGYHRDLVEAATAGLVVTPEMESREGAPESIHTKAVRAREPNLHHKLIYDWHRRATFLDHFLGDEATLDSFYRSNYPELGDFVNQPYGQAIAPSPDGGITLRLFREGHVWQGAVMLPVTVEKVLTFRPGSDRLEVSYIVTNGESGRLDTRFGVESNWGLAGGDGDHTYLTVGFGRYSLGEISSNDDIEDFTITSELWGLDIHVDVDRPAMLWRFPLEAISASEAGFERNYQGTVLLLWWPLQLAARQSWKVTLSFALSQLGQG